MHVLLKHYNRLLRRHPVLSPAIQTSILMGTGDVLAQTIVARYTKDSKTSAKYSYIRTSHFAAIGFFLVGPATSQWYRLLARLVGDKGRIVALKKVAIDQLIFAPTFLIIFLTALGTLRGQHITDTFCDIRESFKDIMIANYEVWPLIQLVNFYVVPVRFQFLIVQTVALVWNTYLSWRTQSRIDCE